MEKTMDYAPLVTTTDNPWNPYTQFEEWNEFDQAHKYNTLSYLARIYQGASQTSLSEQHYSWLMALNEVVEMNPTLYKFADMP